MQQRIRRISGPVLVAAAVGGIIWASAGDLNPPAGTVAPTMKTLTEVEPRIAINATNTPGDDDSIFLITAGGSYYLTGNVTGTAGKHGIKIAADSTIVDLNGFTLSGGGGSLDGIHACCPLPLSPRARLTVRNGVVAGWGGAGVNFGAALHSVLQDLIAWQNTGDGLIITDGGRVERCTSTLNGGTGISAENSLIRGNTAIQNAQNIVATGGSTVIDNHAP